MLREKGEKVDYAIMVDGAPVVLIEAKNCKEKLENHQGQLFRYFSVTSSRFAILTNGIIYRFYTDLDEKNKMDSKPFLEIDMFNLKDSHLKELRKFCKENFDINEIVSSASELKYTMIITQRISDEFSVPSDNFIKLLLSDIYAGVKTQRIIDDFRHIVKNSLSQYVNELINERLKTALTTEMEHAEIAQINPDASTQASTQNGGTILEKEIKEPTEIELQAFFVVRGFFVDIVPLNDISYKNTTNYLAVLYKRSNKKCICRISISGKSIRLFVPAESGSFDCIRLERIEDIYQHKTLIVNMSTKYMND
jgi:hypothetical protein